MGYTFYPKILLHPNIPKPLHLVNPRNILGSSWWNEVREKAYAEKGYHCHACGIHKAETVKGWLEAHECYNIDYAEGRMTISRIVSLCSDCHAYIHSGRLKALLDAGKITQRKHDFIIDRGNDILRRAGCRKFHIDPPRFMAAWLDWYLLLEGKKYFSPFKDIVEWAEYWEKQNTKGDNNEG